MPCRRSRAHNQTLANKAAKLQVELISNASQMKPCIKFEQMHCYMIEISKMHIYIYILWPLRREFTCEIAPIVCGTLQKWDTKWVIFGIERKQVPRQSYLLNMGITWNTTVYPQVSVQTQTHNENSKNMPSTHEHKSERNNKKKTNKQNIKNNQIDT